jgi:hypothetical protein
MVGGLAIGTQTAGAANPAPTVTAVEGGALLSTDGGVQNGVIIKGTDFVDVTAIDFGGVPATGVNCINDSGYECFATAPAFPSTGTVFVTVTAAGGTSATYSGVGDEATYYNPTTITATPALLSLSPFALPLFTLTATVTGKNGAPVPGLTVYFSTETSPGQRDIPPSYTEWCQSTTNSAGVATCSALSLLGVQTITQYNGYMAYTPGSATQFEAQTTAPLLGL